MSEPNPPDRIYLQRDGNGWTWCDTKINDDDPEYICLEQYGVVATGEEAMSEPNLIAELREALKGIIALRGVPVTAVARVEAGHALARLEQYEVVEGKAFHWRAEPSWEFYTTDDEDDPDEDRPALLLVRQP